MENLFIKLETKISDYSKIPFCISWTGMDEKKNELFFKSYLIEEFYFLRPDEISPKIQSGVFSRHNWRQYENLRKFGEIEALPLMQIREKFIEDCSMEVKTILCACGCSFEQEVLQNAMYRIDSDIPFTYFKWNEFYDLFED